MACILHIETSTKVCSVAVSKDGLCVFSKEDLNGPNHAVILGVFIDEALSYVDSAGLMLDAVSISKGPGSYTGLRIGVSMAKGICYARDIKLLGIDTLKLLAVPILLEHEIEDDALIVPMLDARRMEVYDAVYDKALKTIQPTGAHIIDETTYKDLLDKHTVYFFGNGSEKCKEKIVHPNAKFIDNINPLAKYMLPLADREYADGNYCDVAYFVPYYLKDFVATKAKSPFQEKK